MLNQAEDIKKGTSADVLLGLPRTRLGYGRRDEIIGERSRGPPSTGCIYSKDLLMIYSIVVFNLA